MQRQLHTSNLKIPDAKMQDKSEGGAALERALRTGNVVPLRTVSSRSLKERRLWRLEVEVPCLLP